VHIKVRLVPRSKKACIEELGKNYLKVRVSSPPIGERANNELLEIIAQYYNKRKSAVRITKGLHSRNKTVEITE
jgi:uncharacterized protein (TIGR00251 family)